VERQRLGRQLLLQILSNSGFLVLCGGQVQGFDNEPGRIIQGKLAFELYPYCLVILIGQEVFLPNAMEKGSGFAV
jgi:hypothetical protein